MMFCLRLLRVILSARPITSDSFAMGGFSTAERIVPAVVSVPRYEMDWNSEVA